MQDPRINKRVAFNTPNGRSQGTVQAIHPTGDQRLIVSRDGRAGVTTVHIGSREDKVEFLDAEPSNEDFGIPEAVTRGPAFRSNLNPIPYNWENSIERVPDLAPGHAYLVFLDGVPAMTYTFFDVVHVSIIEYQRQGKNVLAVQILHNPTQDQTDAAGFTS